MPGDGPLGYQSKVLFFAGDHKVKSLEAVKGLSSDLRRRCCGYD